ncbi:hypothetical protein Tco_0220142, partial [Tanacetum coccineum]
PTVTLPEVKIIRSSSRPELTDPIVEVQVPQQPESLSHTILKADIGKVLIPYEINGVLYHFTNEQIHEHLEKDKKVAEVATKAGVDPKSLQAQRVVKSS